MKKLEIPANFSIKDAREAQKCIAQKVVSQDKFSKDIQFAAGIDTAYHGDWAVSAVVVMKYDTFEIVETQIITQKTHIPYIPTLFAFRELPPAMAAIRKLRIEPDVFLVDGHGKAHPFGCGFASHLGVAINKPTVGVAKNKLVGAEKRVGAEVFLIYNKEIVGQMVYTRSKVKPVYVSVGHLVSLSTAINLVKHFSRDSRIPEPIQKAHVLASAELRRNCS